MDEATKTAWAESVRDAYLRGDEEWMRQVCSSYEVALNGDGTVTINAAPKARAESVTFTVVKTAYL